MNHVFILFICWGCRMGALLLCYHSIALCTSIGDISANAIYLLRLFIVIQVGLHRLLLLLRWPFLQSSFFFALFTASCSQPTTLRQLTVGMSMLSYGPRHSFRPLRITIVVDRGHLDLKPGIINQYDMEILKKCNSSVCNANKTTYSISYSRIVVCISDDRIWLILQESEVISKTYFRFLTKFTKIVFAY